MEEREHLEVFFLFSLLLHFLAILALRHSVPTPGEAMEMAKQSVIELVPLKEPVLPFGINEHTKQIVTLPKPANQEEPDRSRFVDDYSRKVAEETVSRHKGWGGTPYLEKPKGGADVGPEQQPPGASGKKSGGAGEKLAKLEGDETLLQRILAQNPGEKGRGEKSSIPSYSRLTGVGNPGENQFLPGVKEGELTLLNTKSFTYASFVRRVAYRIFDQFTLYVRNTSFRPDDITQINGYAYVEAVMDMKGNLVGMKLRQSSGSEKWDKLAQDACRAGAWDGNPPKGAESADGYIHFIFAPSTDLLVVGLED